MPGQSRNAARDAFLTPLRRALSCVTTAQLLASPRIRAGDDLEALTLSQDPLTLRSATMGDVSLVLRHQFRIVRDDEAPRSRRWKVSTVAYFYQLDDEDGHELAAWHWHPATGMEYPHLHVAGGRLGKQAHLPTGRVSVESVLRLLIADLGVPPARSRSPEQCLQVLAKAEKDFIGHRTWHA